MRITVVFAALLLLVPVAGSAAGGGGGGSFGGGSSGGGGGDRSAADAKMAARKFERAKRHLDDAKAAEAKLESVARQAEAPARDVSEALKLQVGELRDGYRKIRDAI